MSTYSFDTTLFIDYLRDRREALSLIEEVISGRSTASYSPIVEAELWRGTISRSEEMEVEAVLAVCEFAELTSAAARAAGLLLRGRSPDEGRSHFGDALIAATAMLRNEPLVTADARAVRVFGSHARYQVYR